MLGFICLLGIILMIYLFVRTMVLVFLRLFFHRKNAIYVRSLEEWKGKKGEDRKNGDFSTFFEMAGISDELKEEVLQGFLDGFSIFPILDGQISKVKIMHPLSLNGSRRLGKCSDHFTDQIRYQIYLDSVALEKMMTEEKEWIPSLILHEMTHATLFSIYRKAHPILAKIFSIYMPSLLSKRIRQYYRKTLKEILSRFKNEEILYILAHLQTDHLIHYSAPEKENILAHLTEEDCMEFMPELFAVFAYYERKNPAGWQMSSCRELIWQMREMFRFLL